MSSSFNEIKELDWLIPGQLYSIWLRPRFDDDSLFINEITDKNELGRWIKAELESPVLALVLENKSYICEFGYDCHWVSCLKILYKNKVCFLSAPDRSWDDEEIEFVKVE